MEMSENILPKLFVFDPVLPIDSLSESLSKEFPPLITFIKLIAVQANACLYFPKRSQTDTAYAFSLSRF